MRETYAYRFFVEEPLRKEINRKTRRMLKGNIKMDVREIGWTGVIWLRMETGGGLL
jgi:hypothetical protein